MLLFSPVCKLWSSLLISWCLLIGSKLRKISDSVLGAGLALTVTAAATCAFVQLHAGQAGPPDPDRWLLVPVSEHELPPDLMAEGSRPDFPGVLLHGHMQIVPRHVKGSAQTVRFSAFLGQGASLHTFFGARGLERRGRAVGTTLFISRTTSPELYHVDGGRMTRQPCAFGSLESEGGRVDVTIELRGAQVTVVIRGPKRTASATCPLRAGGQGQVGFRAGQAALVLTSVELEDASGRLLLEYAGRGGVAARLKAAALTLAAVGLCWLLEAMLFGWLLGRGFRAGLLFSAWTSLPLVVLPLLGFFVDMGVLAHGLRLARTSTLALQLSLALALLLLVRALALLIQSRRLRCTELDLVAAEPGGARSLARLLRLRQVQVSGGALGTHALAVTALTLISGQGVLAAAGLEVALVAEAIATLAAALALPTGTLLLLRWLVPGHGVKLAGVVALSWAPSLAAAALALVLLAAGALESWNTPLQLLAGAGASLVFVLMFLQVNARAARGVNWISLACVALLGLTAEGAARQTYLDTAWAGAPVGRFRSHDQLGWQKADKEFDYILNKQRPTKYPLDSFPVAFSGVKPAGAKRIVCLGGSSTGGAFQMDNLDSFFPAELQRSLDGLAGAGRYEVLNQGVGGWNTFHIRLYLELIMDRLKPDILVLYVGHNDIMTRSNETYREYWGRYRMQHSSLKSVMETLDGSRLFVGYRSLLKSLHGGSKGGTVSSVPLPDAQDNLERIIALARRSKASVVLLSEAINTQAQTLIPYRKMQAELARQHGQHYLDTNGLFWKLRQEDLFLDHNHLTSRGHQRLAELLGDFLKARGMVRAVGK